jgi:hypothetical protein
MNEQYDVLVAYLHKRSSSLGSLGAEEEAPLHIKTEGTKTIPVVKRRVIYVR